MGSRGLRGGDGGWGQKLKKALRVVGVMGLPLAALGDAWLGGMFLLGLGLAGVDVMMVLTDLKPQDAAVLEQALAAGMGPVVQAAKLRLESKIKRAYGDNTDAIEAVKLRLSKEDTYVRGEIDVLKDPAEKAQRLEQHTAAYNKKLVDINIGASAHAGVRRILSIANTEAFWLRATAAAAAGVTEEEMDKAGASLASNGVSEPTDEQLLVTLAKTREDEEVDPLQKEHAHTSLGFLEQRFEADLQQKYNQYLNDEQTAHTAQRFEVNERLIDELLRREGLSKLRQRHIDAIQTEEEKETKEDELEKRAVAVGLSPQTGLEAIAVAEDAAAQEKRAAEEDRKAKTKEAACRRADQPSQTICRRLMREDEEAAERAQRQRTLLARLEKAKMSGQSPPSSAPTSPS